MLVIFKYLLLPYDPVIQVLSVECQTSITVVYPTFFYKVAGIVN